MEQAHDQSVVQEAVEHLLKALTILDRMQEHAAAAQVDQVIQAVQGRSDNDLGR